MAVDDRWYKKDRETGKKVPSARYGRGKRWRVRNSGYRDTMFERKADAENLDKVQGGQIVSGRLPWDPSRGAVTFEKYATDVLTSEYTRGLITERTYKKYMGQLKLHVFPAFGERRMNDIDARVIKDWVAWLGTRISRKTGEPIGDSARNLLWIVVGSVFKEAQIDRVKPEHPMASVDRVAKPGVPVARPWSRETVAAVLESMSHRNRGPAAMSAMLGARPGESLAFALDDFQQGKRRVRIRHGIVYGGAGGVRLAWPKNKSVRTVPCPPEAAALVREHAERYGTVRVWCDCHKEWNDIVFHDDGRLWSPRRYERRAWTPAVKAVGLLDADGNVPETATQPSEQPRLRVVGDDERADDKVDLRPGQHQLRHWYASVEIADGTGQGEVQKRLGHKSPETTMRIYHHLFDEQDDDAADRMSKRVQGLPIFDGEPGTGASTGTGEQS